MSKFIYLLSCFIIDTFLNIIFPIDYASIRLSFVSSMGIVSIMFISRDLDFVNSLLIAFIFGFLVDITHYAYFSMFALSYTLTILLIRVWSNQVNESLPEFIILGILTIFVKEVIIFIIMRGLSLSSMTFLTWFTYRQFISLIGNIPLIILAYYGYAIKNQFKIRKDIVRRKHEKTLWMKVSNPFE